MKVNLLYPEKVYDFSGKLNQAHKDLDQDLELNLVVEKMSNKNALILQNAKHVLLSGTTSVEEITYRQQIAKDILDNSSFSEKLFQLSEDAYQAKRGSWWSMHKDTATSILYSTNNLLNSFIDILVEMNNLFLQNQINFNSTGMQSLAKEITQRIDRDYVRQMKSILKDLRFNNGIFIGVSLDQRKAFYDFKYRKNPKGFSESIHWKFTPDFALGERDDRGMKDLGERQSLALYYTAQIMDAVTDEIFAFLDVLRSELSFYIGCLNLSRHLKTIGANLTFPVATELHTTIFETIGLYDISLAIVKNKSVVSNDVHASGKSTILITGANQGGKSTFLRSVGQAQVMMQAGMFVAANSLEMSINQGVFTHFIREEDRSMISGKLDEELKRLQLLVDQLAPYSTILMNESFASTNEQEGSEIAFNVLKAFQDNHIRVWYVTHLFELAHRFYQSEDPTIHYLIAERFEDGRRSFKMKEEKPRYTSFAEDIYLKIFNEEK